MADAALELELEAVYRAYRERIHRHVLYLVKDPELARDLTQETFLRAHQQLAALEDPDALAVWLYRIATRLCVDRFRRKARSPEAPAADAEDGEGGGPDVDDRVPSLQVAVEQAEMSACVRRVVDELPESYRAVLLLAELHGLTGPEVAERLECSLATVKIRLHRARRKLEAALRAGCHLSRDERGVLVCEPRGDAARRR